MATPRRGSAPHTRRDGPASSPTSSCAATAARADDGRATTRTGGPTIAPLTAVIFDVDGTLVDSERDGHRVAFNQAFEEFGLPDRWDVATYGRLLSTTGGQRRLHRHLEGRGMSQAERDAIVPQLHDRKTEIFRDMVLAGDVAARPGVARLLDELDEAGVRLAVATTGTRAWVAPLLDHHFGAGRFEVVVTGDEVPNRKPDPACHLAALDRLGLTPDDTVSVEDAHPGLVASLAAGLPTVAVANDYTRDQDLSGAVFIVDGFGMPGAPAAVLADDHGIRPSGILDVPTLRSVLESVRT